MDKQSPSPAVLASRLNVVRLDRFGNSGAPALAMLMGLPVKTWLNYEDGCVIPGHVILKFMVAFNVSPAWLLNGEGRMYGSDS